MTAKFPRDSFDYFMVNCIVKMLGLSKNCLISKFIIELYILHLQAVISSEEEEGHQGRIDRKVLFRY